MNTLLIIYGVLLVWGILHFVVKVARYLRRIEGYACAVKAYISIEADVETVYNEKHMIRCYENDTCASDAAREMVSKSRNAKEVV